MNDEPSYHEIDSLTLGEHWQFAADTDRIAFAQTDGEILLFDASGRETVTLPDSLSALEVERYLLCLSGTEVSAYTTSGVELWTQTVHGATDIVAFGEKDVLAVLTEDGSVVGLDLEAGGRLFETHRPHDDFTDTYVAGGNGLLCIGAWSFVVCLDTSGSVLVDRNLDSTVEGVSVLDDLALVALKDGTVVTLDPTTGETQWSNSANLRHLASRGRAQVPALTESGSAVIHAEGRIEQLEVETGQRIVSATDGSVLGIADETSVRIYRRGPPPSTQLEVDVLTTELHDETPVRFYVENTGSTSVETTLSLDSSQQFRADSQHVPLELDAGESREVAFRLRELPPADQFEYDILADDTELEHGSIPIARQVNLSEAVAVETSRQRVIEDTVVVRSRVENTSETTLDTVRIGDETVTDFAPGETMSVDHDVPLDGSVRTVRVEILHRNATETLERQLSAPEDAVQVALSRGDDETPCLDIDVQPTVQARVRGEVTVDLLDEVTVSRELELNENERFTLALFVPPSVSTRDEIPVVVDSPLLATRTRTRIEGWDERAVQRLYGTVPTADTQDLTREPRPSQRVDGRHDRDRKVRDGDTPNSSQRDSTDVKQGDRQTRSSHEPALQVERTVTQQAQRSTVFVEQLRITNTSRQPLEDVTISDPDTQYRVDELGAGDEITVQRHHAFFETGTQTLPPVQVDTERTSSHELRVVEPDIECRATAAYDGAAGQARITVTVANGSENRCTIPRAGIDISEIDSGQTWEFEEPFVVPPGETETRSSRIDLPTEQQLEYTTRLVIVECQQGGDRTRFQTLAPLKTTASTGDTPVSVTLLDKSRLVADTQGIVDVAIENASQKPLEDGTLTVEGDIVMETALSQDSKTVPRLAPGDRETLLVDVMPEATDTASVDVVVEGTVDGEPVTQRLTFTGPVAETGEEWERNAYLDEWTTTADDEPARVELEDTHLSTRLQPTEGGSHR